MPTNLGLPDGEGATRYGREQMAIATQAYADNLAANVLVPFQRQQVDAPRRWIRPPRLLRASAALLRARVAVFGISLVIAGAVEVQNGGFGGVGGVGGVVALCGVGQFMVARGVDFGGANGPVHGSAGRRTRWFDDCHASIQSSFMH
jgi:hypothetical protein